MGAESLKAGDKIELSDGAVAEVTGALANGGVPVRIIDSPFGPDAPGADKVADPDEIFGVFIDDAMTEVRAL
mgnify:CR=1 FL=1|jgi:hypothetical protein